MKKLDFTGLSRTSIKGSNKSLTRADFERAKRQARKELHTPNLKPDYLYKKLVELTKDQS